MPTQLLAGTVAMLSYPRTQTFDLRDERASIEIQKVVVHGVPTLARIDATDVVVESAVVFIDKCGETALNAP